LTSDGGKIKLPWGEGKKGKGEKSPLLPGFKKEGEKKSLGV